MADQNTVSESTTDGENGSPGQGPDPKNMHEVTLYKLAKDREKRRMLLYSVQSLLQNMQDKFQSMSDQIINRIDEMGTRVDELEKNITDLMTQAGVENEK